MYNSIPVPVTHRGRPSIHHCPPTQRDIHGWCTQPGDLELHGGAAILNRVQLADVVGDDDEGPARESVMVHVGAPMDVQVVEVVLP
jgi:hypothetical protein